MIIAKRTHIYINKTYLFVLQLHKLYKLLIILNTLFLHTVLLQTVQKYRAKYFY